MTCNCNDDNRYIIQLDNVGVDGFSPTINFTDQTSESFKISVVDINGTSVSDVIPLYGYVSNALTNINSSIGSINININNMSGDITTLQGQMANIPTTYLSKSEAASTYLSQANAASTYLTQSNAASTYLSKTDAISTYLSKSDATATYLKKDGSNAASPLYLNSVMLYNNSVSANSLSGAYIYATHLSVADNADLEIRNARDKDIVLSTQNGGKVLYNYGSGYNEIATINQIPTVNDATITLTQGGVTKGTFTVNSSSDVTIDLDAGGGTSTDAEKLVYEGTKSWSFQIAENNSGYIMNKYTVSSGGGSWAASINPFTSVAAGSGITSTAESTSLAGRIGLTKYTVSVDTDVIVPRVTNYTPSGQSYTIDTTINNGSINITDNFNNDEITLEANKITFTTGGYDEELYVSGGTLYYNTDQVATLADIPEIETGTTDGTISVDGTDVPVYGLGSMAYQSTNNYVTKTNAALKSEIEPHKAYEADGDLLTDSKGLADVTAYAHSTYDSSKFTKVGSPVITDDGIASGFSVNNVVKLAGYWNIGTYDSWMFKGEFTTGDLSNLSSSQSIVAINANYAKIFAINQYKQLFLELNTTNSSNWDICDRNNAKSTQTLNSYTKYYYRFYFTGTSYKVDISTDKRTWINYITVNSTLKIYSTSTTEVYIGNSNLQYAIFTGSMDLTEFSITADGVPVFSGNKTGIDTIKPDDYTKVGSPTISADGIVSGFSSSNKLYASINATSNSNSVVILKGRIKLPSTTPTTAQQIYYFQQSATAFVSQLNINTSSNLNLYATDGTNTGSTSLNVTNYLGQWINYVCKVSNNSRVIEVYTDTGAFIGSNSNNTVLSWTGISGDIYAWIGTTNVSTYPFESSIDLNAFKIYVDGNLVYQPCLKIPYTESKTGSKIVDSIYRNRVSDMYSQYGYAPYYTLLEGTNFTLPQGELYGLIGQRTLRDTYRNGIFYYDLYSDRTLEQGGSCTSGTDVTFLKPFADTNYVLTVPYSAKTATGFTPSQTGDWVAKGIGA